MKSKTNSLVAVRLKVAVMDPDTLTLPELKAEVHAHMGEVRSLGRRLLKEAITIGVLLNAAKSQLKHGEWYPFLREVGISPDWARKLRYLADHLGDVDQNAFCKRFPNLGIDRAYATVKRTVTHANRSKFNLDTMQLALEEERARKAEEAHAAAQERLRKARLRNKPTGKELIRAADEIARTAYVCENCGYRHLI